MEELSYGTLQRLRFIEVMKKNNRGKFIVIEGLDGSGSSTQVDAVADRLKNIVKTHEPSPGPVGDIIRKAFKGLIYCPSGHRETLGMDGFDRYTAELFVADRTDHLYNDLDGIVNELNAGVDVISSRYRMSSVVYHCQTTDQANMVRAMNAHFPEPDLTVYLDITVAESLKRLQGRTALDSYENEEVLTRVRANYEVELARTPGKVFKVAATLPKEQITELILAEIAKL